MKQIRLGSRESRLAVIQAELVRDALQRVHPDWDVIIKTYKTMGDKILDRPLDKIGGKGLFTKELELELLSGEIDLIVHSLKDVPMQVDARIPIVGVMTREDERDALVLPKGENALDLGKLIGCSSKRRALQLRALYPGCMVAPVRGNVLTRLEKLDSGQFGALVLAAAGLKRLSLEGRITRLFSPEEMLPAACQGVLALQARAEFDRSVLLGVCDEQAHKLALAERSFVRMLDGGCSSPVAAHAVQAGEEVTLTGLYVEEDGETLHFDRITGPLREAEALGRTLAVSMKETWGAK
ncbi:MAG: hydroxymethylbilane synthase [Clostridia bacterium]|nr:hydroxymethylbilane synthase [Clostridia bacterium]